MASQVTIRGTGRNRSGIVVVNKSMEMDDVAARAFVGAAKDDAITSFVQTHYPGTQVNPRQMTVNVNPINNEKKATSSSGVDDFGKAILGGIIGGTVAKKPKRKGAKSSENEDKTENFSKKLAHLTLLTFHGDLIDTMKKLDSIAIQTTGFRWEFSPNTEVGKENNRILNRCVKQFKFGIRRLKELTDEADVLKKYKKKLSWLRWKRFFNYTWLFWLFAGIMAAIGILSFFE